MSPVRVRGHMQIRGTDATCNVRSGINPTGFFAGRDRATDPRERAPEKSGGRAVDCPP